MVHWARLLLVAWIHGLEPLMLSLSIRYQSWFKALLLVIVTVSGLWKSLVPSGVMVGNAMSLV